MTEQPAALSAMNAARNGPANTCPASRHAAMIAEALISGQGYPMLTEDPTHCGETIAAVVEALWTVRAQLAEARAMLDDTTTLHRIVADIREKSGVGSKPMLADLAGAIGDKLADARAVNEELRAAVAIAEDYAHRAEAERAAQIEADRKIVMAMLVRYDGIAKAETTDERLRPMAQAGADVCDKIWREINAQPHDRTALDAATRAAKVEAWKEAAGIAETVATHYAKAAYANDDGRLQNAARVYGSYEIKSMILAQIGEGV